MILSFSIELGSLEHFSNNLSGRHPESYDPDRYEPYVGRPLSEASRLLLYEWNNGSILSRKKHDSVVKNIRYRSQEYAGAAILQPTPHRWRSCRDVALC